MTKRRWLVPILLALLLVLGANACRLRPEPPPDAEARLADLAALDQLQAAFEQDGGKPRLLLILAPT